MTRGCDYTTRGPELYIHMIVNVQLGLEGLLPSPIDLMVHPKQDRPVHFTGTLCHRY